MSKKQIDKLNEKLKIVVDKKNKSFLYNIKQVSSMFGLNTNLEENELCTQLINFLRESDSKIAKDLLKEVGDKGNICNILVNSLYELFSPSDLSEKAKIDITEKEYKKLIQKKKDKKIDFKENQKLEEALNIKYCRCVKKLYLKNQVNLFITGKEPKYNPYAICVNSIYNNRNIQYPFKISYSCREKYDWYKKI